MRCCLEYQQALQRWLDGDGWGSSQADLEGHLTTCSDCRELFAAAHRLRDGLHVLVPPTPPAHLTARVCARLTVDRRRGRRFRQAIVLSAIAASLVVTLFASYRGPRSTEPATLIVEGRGPISEPLRQSILETGQAVVA